ncbi:MAG TPA: aryl-sulfate sulfotransferase [Terriglobales bacterium]|nr:aryl-sulfate sulfotransferase [Terriglobales bacterium]
MKPLRLAAAALAAIFVLLFPAIGRAASSPCTPTLTASPPSPQLVGQRVIWTATPANCGAAPVYKYRIATTSGFRVVRDFNLGNTLSWGPLQEGPYQVMVSVKDGFSATDSTSAVVSGTINSLVTGTQAVVTPMLNPLMALYSAPACDSGSVHVQFRPVPNTSGLPWTITNTLPCVHGQTRNFLVAGMLANTSYEMAHANSDGTLSDAQVFTTGTPPPSLDIPTFTVRRAPSPQSDLSQGVVYHNFTARGAPNAVNLIATDMSGRVEWYVDPLDSGIQNGTPGVLEAGGTVFFLGRDSHRTRGFNVLREIDLAGNTLRETNIDAVNAQLQIKGQETIYGFHHDVLLLPDGNVATLGWTLRTVDINGKPTQYVGQMLVVLDQDFQVIWTWDAFDHMDVNRGPILHNKCTGAPCPIPGAVDWLHSNSIAWSAEDSNLLMSVRHQAWEIKIDYRNGSGDGHIIWRLGKDGDFAVVSSDPSPWFSYQHNVHYLDQGTLLLFDNGNVRCLHVKQCRSRGQTWAIDEKAMTATLKLNVDLNRSDALGSAEALPNGNFVFTSGALARQSSLIGKSIEVSPDGTKQYVLEGGAWEYRTYRMTDLYDGIPK